MKRSSKLIILLTSAFIAFGSLKAFVGNERSLFHRYHCHYQHATICENENKTTTDHKKQNIKEEKSVEANEKTANNN